MLNDLYAELANKLIQTSAYTLDPVGYAKEVLNVELWEGSQDSPGQADVASAYLNAIDLQLKRHKGDPSVKDSDIKNWIRVESGHGVGKTALAAVLALHFFTHFDPAIIQCYAPRFEQVNDHLFKDIRVFRNRDPNAPGEALERKPEVKHKANHSIKGKATKGGQTESAQGAHEQYMLFILDEAEGIDDYIFDAVASMASGGIVTIVLMLANPRTRASRFYRMREHPNSVSFTISCLHHPNVLQNRNIIPGAVRRDYVETMILEHCSIVPSHEPDLNTFEVPWRTGTIYAPNAEFMFRVLGLPPSDSSSDTFCPPGRYKSIFTRKLEAPGDLKSASIGVDAARYGDDNGTIYVRHGDRVWLETEIGKSDGYIYYTTIVDIVHDLVEKGVQYIDIRIDGGGGYGSTAIDNLNRESWVDDEGEPLGGYLDIDGMREPLPIVSVREVLNNSLPYDLSAFSDTVTELYYHAGQACYVIEAVGKFPDSLEDDLCFRHYGYKTRKGRHVKALVPKEQFRKKYNRSPDHGDGFSLCVAPSYLFESDVEIGFA